MTTFNFENNRVFSKQNVDETIERFKLEHGQR